MIEHACSGRSRRKEPVMDEGWIINYIPYGMKNAVDRYKLQELTGRSDRDNRRAISAARKQTVILSREDGGGYYRPTADEIAEIEKYIKQEKSRALTVLTNLRTANHELRKREWEDKLKEYKQMKG